VTTLVSINRILAEKALQKTCGQQCVDWALGMLESGHDGSYLQRLAAMSPPHNHFEIAALRDRALEEQGIAAVTHRDALTLYARELLRNALADRETIENAVAEVACLCWTNDYIKELFDFYLLHFAYEDLRDEEIQWYWDGATRANVQSLMRERAERFVRGESCDQNG
jgi:hypothetical protein